MREKALLFKDCKCVVGREGKVMEELLSVVSPGKVLLWGEGGKAEVRVVENCPGDQGREVVLNWQDRRYRFRIPFADDASFENCMNAFVCCC